MIYIDPPYGIKFASNFQPEVGKRDVKDKESDLTREPEMVKAYRDTWTLGVHSYLAYLRDRLMVAKKLRLEQACDLVAFYARNDHLELSIPYEYLGGVHAYFPDFVVRLTNSVTLLLEIKGEERERGRTKHQAARRWVSAVNYWGQLGPWAFHACKDPQRVIDEIRDLHR